MINYCKCSNHIAQLFKLIDIIDYNKGKKIRHKEYLWEYFICQTWWEFNSLGVYISDSINFLPISIVLVFFLPCKVYSGNIESGGGNTPPIIYPYRFSIHLIASISLTLPRYRCVVDRFAWRKITLLTISIGVPLREA